MMTARPVLAIAIALALTLAARERAGAQAPRGGRSTAVRNPAGGLRLGLSGGLSIPGGDLGGSSDAGIAIGVRGEAPLADARWRVRGDLTFDRFGGRGIVDSYAYTSLAANLVHRGVTSHVYQFGGLGVYNARTAFVAAADRSSTDLGVQAGIGFDLGAGPPRWFVETGLASAFTSGRSSVWFPVRAGFWF